MSKEEGILNRENTKEILSKVDRNFFKGGFSGIGKGNTNVGDSNAPAMVAMHKDLSLAFGTSRVVAPNSKLYDQVLAEEKAKVTGAVSKAVQSMAEKSR